LLLPSRRESREEEDPADANSLPDDKLKEQ